MKVFRVRDAGCVESHIDWKMMDGTAFASVGGRGRPYVTVAPALLPAGTREGAVTQCAIEEVRRGQIMLVPSECDDGKALVIVPSGAFNFHFQPVVSVDDAAWMFVMSPGDHILAYPKVATLGDAIRAKHHVLEFDGETVRFFPT